MGPLSKRGERGVYRGEKGVQALTTIGKIEIRSRHLRKESIMTQRSRTKAGIIVKQAGERERERDRERKREREKDRKREREKRRKVEKYKRRKGQKERKREKRRKRKK